MFPGWQIGLDIQKEGVRAIAVQKCRQGWQLRHWWHLPFPSDAYTDPILSQPDVLLDVLDSWRKQLPCRYRLSVSFPAQRTFQRKVAIPDENLCEAVHENYVAYTTAQQLQMPVSQLCCDYLEQDGVVNVTAALQSDINRLFSCLKSVQLFPGTVTPCDKVLCALPAGCYPQACQYLIHEESDYWLWASRHGTRASGWQDKRQCPDLTALCQWLNTTAESMAFSTACMEDKSFPTLQNLDVWSLLTRLYPPVPQVKGRYTIALGLALGGAH